MKRYRLHLAVFLLLASSFSGCTVDKQKEKIQNTLQEHIIAHPFLLFAAVDLHKDEYLETWVTLEHFPMVNEVLRNLPIRNPIIWIN